MTSSIEGLSQELDLIDEIYAQFRKDPSSVDPSWRRLFEARELVASEVQPAPAITPAGALPTPVIDMVGPRGFIDAAVVSAVYMLVSAYRTVGHLAADLDPLGMRRIEAPPELDPATYGLTEADLQRWAPNPPYFGVGVMPVGKIIERLRATYAAGVGVEFMHISSPPKRAWLCERMESGAERELDRETRVAMLERLASAEVFERFAHSKYVGTKRFSIEGSETLIPLIDLVLEAAGEGGAREVVLGMAHRGRLNVLAHIMHKAPIEIFAEFEDIEPESTLGAGDVKYHLGYSTEHVTRGGHRMHLSLTFNPSHLEAVDPVVVGRVRAKQARRKDGVRSEAMGLLIHGDAAFAGQGLVAETLNLSELRGYRTGGTVHVIVNNQIGFTTPPEESRSTRYCTDVAKMLECPIFHVNGEDIKAVANVVRTAMLYRARFHNDVVIDLFGYRKYGHNEADEPSYTQPLLYRRIQQQRSVFAQYSEEVIGEGLVTREQLSSLVLRLQQRLEDEWALARTAATRPRQAPLRGVWHAHTGGPPKVDYEVDTGLALERLGEIAERSTSLPVGFHAHPKVARLMQLRAAMGRGERPLDWSMAEVLAFGSLLWDGTPVRLSGQDSGRGTFSQRHAIVSDVDTGAGYTPLEHLHEGQAWFGMCDSPLSEAAVLGFEFGFSLDYPDALVMWEAQFGDFVNGGQVIVDQFLSSSESKWRRLSGLTLLLPHAFEGQGPEHSSARFERFLQLAAEDNLQVVYPTTPAQYFHLLRRQVLRRWRKPLVVMTPKGLLRHAAATSALRELAGGRFQPVLADPDAKDPSQVRRVLLCTGKIFYELAEERSKRKDSRSAIVRIEELMPWRSDEVRAAVSAWPLADRIVWVQEEPANMGGASYVLPQLEQTLGRAVALVSRPKSASSATGSHKAHLIEQHSLIAEAFNEH